MGSDKGGGSVVFPVNTTHATPPLPCVWYRPWCVTFVDQSTVLCVRVEGVIRLSVMRSNSVLCVFVRVLYVC